MESHPRDSLIHFDADKHMYTVDGVEGTFVSVTQIIKAMFTPFDPVSELARMRKDKSDSLNEPRYLGKTDQEILQLWETNRDEAVRMGKTMHTYLELCLKRELDIPIDETVMSVSQLVTFLQDHSEWKPVRCEWAIYDEESRIAGTVDALFMDESTGKRILVDWKRMKTIKNFSRSKGKFGTPVSDLYDTQENQYHLQANMYQHLIEKRYGITIDEKYLILFHPELKAYSKVPVKDYKEYAKKIVKHRVDTINKE
jgi:hypothetical protein